MSTESSTPMQRTALCRCLLFGQREIEATEFAKCPRSDSFKRGVSLYGVHTIQEAAFLRPHSDVLLIASAGNNVSPAAACIRKASVTRQWKTVPCRVKRCPMIPAEYAGFKNDNTSREGRYDQK